MVAEVSDISAGPAPQDSRLERFVFALDESLRRWERIHEYSHGPACIFRIHVGPAPEGCAFAEGDDVRRGDTIVHLHLWNEHIPQIGPGGVTVKWAAELRRRLHLSLRELAQYLEARPELRAVAAIRGEMVVASPQQAKALARVVQHLGFTVFLDGQLSIADRLRRLGENILARMIVSAVNPGATRGGILRRGRVRMCMSRATLARRYGSAGPVARPRSQRPPLRRRG